MIKIVGYVLFAFTFISYARLIQTIFRLVSESRQVPSGMRFNRFWWLPAWRVHQSAYPASSIRLQIVWGFLLTFALMIFAMACLAVSILHSRGL